MTQYDIAVPIFKKTGWYDNHPFKSFIERFYKDLDEVRLWIGSGQCTVDHNDKEYHKFLDKYGLDKYTKDDSFSKQSQDDLYYVLYDVMHDYLWPLEPEAISNHLSTVYQERIADKIRKNNGDKIVRYENGETYDIVKVFTQKAFSNPLSSYFWKWKRRKNNYAWYKRN